MTSQTKEKGSWIWDFQGEAGTLQIDENKQTCSKQILAGPPTTVGHRGKFNKQALLDFSLFATCSLYYDAKVMLSFFKQFWFFFFYLNFLRQLKGRGSKILYLLLLHHQLKIYIPKDLFRVAKFWSPAGLRLISHPLCSLSCNFYVSSHTNAHTSPIPVIIQKKKLCYLLKDFFGINCFSHLLAPVYISLQWQLVTCELPTQSPRHLGHSGDHDTAQQSRVNSLWLGDL